MKIAPSEWQLARRTGRTEAVILFVISGQTFAITASAIHEIRSTDSISGAASEITVEGIAKVRHVLHRGRKSYYVVNGCAHFGLPTSKAGAGSCPATLPCRCFGGRDRPHGNDFAAHGAATGVFRTRARVVSRGNPDWRRHGASREPFGISDGKRARTTQYGREGGRSIVLRGCTKWHCRRRK